MSRGLAQHMLMTCACHGHTRSMKYPESCCTCPAHLLQWPARTLTPKQQLIWLRGRICCCRRCRLCWILCTNALPVCLALRELPQYLWEL